MFPPTRITDSTFGTGSHGEDCCPHSFSGMHTQGEPTVLIEDLPVARITDLGIHFCPHCSINMNIQGVTDVLYGDLPSHCLTDQVTEFCGMGTSTQANNTVFDG